MKILVIGGHLTPALATIDKLVEKKAKVVFVGKAQTNTPSDDKTEMSKRGIEFRELKTGKVHRHSMMKAAMSLSLLPMGFGKAWKILKETKPDGVLSFGGYLAVPVVWAAWMQKIPVVIHEQTHHAGLGNKVTAVFAKKIALGFEGSAKYFPKEKTVLVGNPVRLKILNKNVSGNLEIEKPFVYVTGGHQGASAINKAVFDDIEGLLNEYGIVHSIGVHKAMDEEWDTACKLMSKYKGRYLAKRYFDENEVGGVMRGAEIVISRSGANTCSELAHLGKPCLLVPLPSGQNNEQYENALLLEKLGLAKIVNQMALTSETLISEIKLMKRNLKQYVAKENEVKKLFPIDAGEKLADLIIETCKK